MNTNNTPIVEDVSMEDAAKQYYNDNIDNSNIPREYYEWEIIQFMSDFAQQREQQLIPIIKELGEKLNQFIEFHEKNASWDKTGQVYYNSKTTLDKYKNYL